MVISCVKNFRRYSYLFRGLAMKIDIEINDYNPLEGLKLNWIGDYSSNVKYDNGVVILTANNDGLMSLANH